MGRKKKSNEGIFASFSKFFDSVQKDKRCDVIDEMEFFTQGLSTGFELGVKKATAEQRKKSTNQNT